MPPIAAHKCACGKPGAYRYKVQVLGSTVWCVVCAEHLEWEREMQGGYNPPALEPFTPTESMRPNVRPVQWAMIRTALSLHPLTTWEIVQATGLPHYTVKRVMHEHADEVALRRQGCILFWELLETLEEIPY